METGWTTPQAIDAALADFEHDLHWRRPALHGVGLVSVASAPGPTGACPDDEEEIRFVRVDEGENLLAAAVLATVTGWQGQLAGTVRFDQAQLGRAIELLSPAEACRRVPQPHLAVWRDLRGWHLDGVTLMAVFDPDPDTPTDDPYVAALRSVVASGRQAVPEDTVHAWPSPHPLQERWLSTWPQVPPVSHRLRELNERWVRFHSLPDAKRYADTDAEYATILHRHNTVLTELAGDAAELQVITLEVECTPQPRQRTPVLLELLPRAECWSTLSWPDLDPVLTFAHLYVNRVEWRPGCLDAVLREAADDGISDVIIAPPGLSWLYAPYDGGVDVLLPTTARRDGLRDAHRDWLSDHPGGL
ncbi:MAG: hypothetical protein WCA46_14575 [Actinocatenispora sp.]